MNYLLLPLLAVFSGCHLLFPFDEPAGADAGASGLDLAVDAPVTEALPPSDMLLDIEVDNSVISDLGQQDLPAPDGPHPDAPQPSDGGVLGTWVNIASGTFTMGSPTTEPCRNKVDETLHEVKLTHDFEIQATEVTQGQFLSMMGYNPAHFATCGSDCPVETVSWHEAAAYCNALSTKKGYTNCYQCSGTGASVSCKEAFAYSGQGVYNCPGYRLPTEAEWEYAYRAGTQTAFYSGGTTATLGTCINCKADPNADKIGWHCGNSGLVVHAVKGKQPNAWGLYDMAGNAREWCHDWRQTDLGSSPVTNPWGPATGSGRAARGGSLSTASPSLRAADRQNYPPTYQLNDLGFRCARAK